MSDQNNGVDDTRQSFNWSALSATQIAQGATVNTGSVEVEFDIVNNGGHYRSTSANESINVTGIESDGEAVNAHSGLLSDSGADGTRVDYQWTFSTPVDNVSFNIADIDGASDVTIRAYDLQGNLIPVSIDAGSKVKVLENTDGVPSVTLDATKTNGSASDEHVAATISIEGPVAMIFIDHANKGYGGSGVIISDMYFDDPTVSDGIVDGTQADDTDMVLGYEDAQGDKITEGDDIIVGGLGDDFINGEGGKDVIIGDLYNGDGAALNSGQLSVTIVSQAGAYNGSLLAEITGIDGSIEVVTLTNNYDANVGQTFNLALDAGDSVRVGITVPGGTTIWSDDNNAVRSSHETDVSARLNFEDDGGHDFDDLVLAAHVSGTALSLPEGNSVGSVTVPVDITGNDTIYGGAGDDLIIGDNKNDGIDGNGSSQLTVTINSQAGAYNGALLAEVTDIQGNVNVITLTNNYDANVGRTFDLALDAGDNVRLGITVPGGSVIWSDNSSVVRSSNVTGKSATINFEDDGVSYASDYDDVVLSASITGSTLALPNGSIGSEAVVTTGEDTIFGGAGDDVIYGDNYSGYSHDGGGNTADDTQLAVKITSQAGKYNGALLAEITGADGSVEVVTLTDNYDANVGRTFDLMLDAGDSIRLGITVPGGTTIWSDNSSVVRSSHVTDDSATLSFEDDGVSYASDYDDVVLSASISGAGIVALPDGSYIGTRVQPESFDAGSDDIITGGEGADTMYGQGGDDTFIVSSADEGKGDTVVGGNGPDQYLDNDTLDLRGAGAVTIDASADATDAGAKAGTVTFANGDTLSFSQIETILQDTANQAPIANDDALNGVEDTAVVTPFADLLANDSDPENQPLSIVSVQNAVNGTVEIINGNVVFTPDADYNGPASYTYTMTDGVNEASATVNLSIAPVNDAPIANDDFLGEFVEGQPITFDVAQILGNDSDPDGDAIRANAVVDTVGGSFAIVNGVPTFTPNAGFVGDATLTYQITDDNGGTDTATITFKIVPDQNANQAPVANDDFLGEFVEGQPIAIDVAQVLSNDSDPDGDAIRANAVINSVGGSFAMVNGVPTFIPDAGFVGDATLTYQITDDNGGTDTATITFKIVPDTNVNQAPIAADDDLGQFDMDTPAAIDVAQILSNDVDPDGDTLTPTAVVATENGQFAFINGVPSFVPDAGFTGTASLTYQVDDGNGGTDTATVFFEFVDPNANNQAPVANDDTLDGASGTTDVVIAPETLLANDTDPNPGDVLQIQSVGNPVNGTVSIDPTTGKVIFSPTAGYCGPASFTYVIVDNGGLTSEATVNLTVADNIIMGSEDADTIEGSSGSDIIQGLGGEDTINGNDGDDCITGGHDSDRIEGGNGNDTINGNQGNDTLKGNAGEDTINGSSGNDLLLGQEGNDKLYGDAGDDTLEGGDGDDLLQGGQENDSLTGGLGADTFVWTGNDIQPHGNGREIDTITDLGAEDVLDLADLLVNEQNSDNLDHYLDFNYDDSTGDTTIAVSALGSFEKTDDSIDCQQLADQLIIIQGVDLTAGNTSPDENIIQSMLNNNQLIVDSL